MARIFKRHSIHGRLFILFLTSMLALLILVSVLYYQKTTEIIHSKISDLAVKNISQTVGLFDLMLEGYDSVTKSLNSNYELLRLLQERDKEEDAAISVINERTITNILGAVYYSRDDIIGIHVISNKGKVYNYERRFAGIVDINYSSTSWYKKLVESNGKMQWFGLSEGSLINSMLQQDPVFVFGRQLYDLTNYKPIGVVLIETNPKPILAALSNVTISPNSRVYIVDRDNRIIASTEPAVESPEDRKDPPSFAGLPRPKRNDIVVDNQTDQLIVAANAAMAEWTVYSLTPKEDISAELAQTRLYLLFVILAVIIIATFLASLISRNIASPLKLLIREMKQVELGNFRGAVNVKSFEEINSLVSSFNRMVLRMDELIERITLSSISEKNAELQALQSQVNPHFLYNTLDMIYWMLDERENDRLGRVILSLSHMFRYSSDWEEASKTTLGQELDQMRHYMTIIENRLEGRIATEINIDTSWLDAPMPKMTLQPIIENAVKSGLEPLDRLGVLRVYAESDEKTQEFRIVIEDNGVGMSEETLTAIRKSMYEPVFIKNGAVAAPRLAQAQKSEARTRRGIGLPNVHHRLALMFGDNYGLRIDSEQDVGTTVVIVMPMPLPSQHSDSPQH
ncbi:cache domain-containing sensor histidine kinase [Paenibacillus radicis (ex Gao et al. 2016)]|uniref:Sensor histidine kinase n=1 Tax=Paenibacillus radicis (ex Gao et al. 2016) TaxID=1737354 RepID=A0A917HAT4_9BACL|nr:sensor histidine kinase [Paenibacillus radicis (ex Gao et al. 2016)]GGG73290.1 sensor histidine kinase [Paenibacillus radicis (ex Gao et al. 2016)]